MVDGGGKHSALARQGCLGTRAIIIGDFEFPLPTVKKKYDILIIGDVHIPVEVT